jgi:hypothetical protein
VNGDTDRRDLLGEGVYESSAISTLGWEGDFLNRERIDGGIDEFGTLVVLLLHAI